MPRHLKPVVIALLGLLGVLGFTSVVFAVGEPTLVSTSPADGESVQEAPTVSATYQSALDPSSTIEVRDATTSRLAGTTGFTDADKTIVFSPADRLAAGQYSVRVVAKDAALPTLATTTEWTFTIDRTPPAKPSISSVEDDTTGPVTGNDTTPSVVVGGLTAGDVVTLSGGTASATKTAAGPTVTFNEDETDADVSVSGDGNKTFTATATDPAGNTSAASDGFVYTLDTTPPDAPAIDSVEGDTASAATGKDTTPSVVVSGVAAGQVVQLFDGSTLLDSKIAAAPLLPGGAVTVTFNAGEADADFTLARDGGHSLTAKAVDGAGNPSAPSDAFVYTLDTTPPAEPVIDSVEGDADTPGLGNDTTPTVVVVNVVSGDVIKVYDGTNLKGTKTASGTTVTFNALETDAEVSLAGDGDHTLTVTATDGVGNASAGSDVFVYTLDTTAPTKPSISSVEADTVSPATGNDTTPTVVVSGVTVGDVVEVYDGTTLKATKTASSSTVTFNALEIDAEFTLAGDGDHTLAASGTDPAGNTSAASDGFVYTLDATAPAAPAINSVEGDAASPASGRDTTPTVVVGGVTAGDVVQLFDGTTLLDSKTAVAPTLPTMGPLTVTFNAAETDADFTLAGDGEHSLTAKAVDSVGNASAASPAFAYSLDTTPPAKPVIDSVDGDTTTPALGNDTTPTVVVSGVTSGDVVTVFDGATPAGTKTATGPTVTFNATDTDADITVSGDSDHNFTATATDSVGNVSAASEAFVYTFDTTAPDAPTIDSVEGDTTSPASGQDASPTIVVVGLTAGDKVTLTGGAAPATKTAAGPTVTFNATEADAEVTVSGDGDKTFTATATDAAENTSDPSDGFVYTLDTTAPDAPTIDSVEGDTTRPAGGRDTTPTVVVGGVTAGDLVQVFDGTTLLAAKTASASTVTFNAAETDTDLTVSGDGAHHLTATATDPVGNASAASTPFTYDLDTTAPAAPAIGSVDGDPASPAVGNDATPSIVVTGVTSSDVVRIFDGTTKVGEKTATGDTVAFNAAAGDSDVELVLDGDHSLTATSADAAGNTSAASPVFLYALDRGRIAPMVTSTSPADEATVQPPATVSATMSERLDEALSTLVVRNGLGNSVLGSISFSSDSMTIIFTPASALTELGNTYTATATGYDGNGNNDPHTWTFSVDTTGPAAPAIDSVEGDTETPATANDTTPSVVVSGVAAGRVVQLFDGSTLLDSKTAAAPLLPGGAVTVTFNAGEADADFTLAGDGGHSLTAKAVDGAGNASAPSDAFVYTLDTTPPAEPVIDSVEGDTDTPALGNDTTPTVVVGGVISGDVVKVYDGTTLKATRTASGTTVTFNALETDAEVTVSGDGDHTLTATATDPVGNASASSEAFVYTLDTTAPTTPTIDSVEGDTNSPATGNDTTPTIVVGGVTSGDVVKVFDGDTLKATKTAEGNTVTFNAADTDAELSSSGDGDHTLTATATDPAGNTSAASDGFVYNLDTTAPAAPALNSVEGDTTSPATGNDTAPSVVVGNLTAGDEVQLFDGTKLVAFKTAEAPTLPGGTVTVTFNADETDPDVTLTGDGDHTLTATATDPVGNTSVASDGFVYTLDTTAPAAPTIDSIEGDTTSPATGNDTTPTVVVGGVTSGDVVKVFEGATLKATKTAAGAIVTFNALETESEVTVSGDGDQTFTATATDPVGNASASSAAFVYTLDTTAPTAPTIDSVEGDTNSPATGNDTTPTVVVRGVTSGDVVKVFEGATLKASKTAAGTTVTFNADEVDTEVTVSGDGDRTFTATAADGVGNISTASDGFVYTLDTTGPTAPTVDSVEGDTTSPATGNDATPTIVVGGVTSGDTVKVFDGATLKATKTAGGTTVTFNAAETGTDVTLTGDGDHTLTATATDPVGNASASSDAFVYSMDTAAPAAPAIDSVEGDTTTPAVGNDVTPTIVVSGVTAGDVVKLFDGATLAATKTATGSSVTFNAEEVDSDVTVSGDGDGDHGLTATATDGVGNASAASATFVYTVDTTAPATPVIDSVEGDATTPAAGNDTTPTVVVGGVTSGDVVKLFAGVTLEATATATGSTVTFNALEADGDFSLSDGSHNLTATSTDAAGNASPTSEGFVYDLDTTVPDAPTITSVGGDTTSPALGNDATPAVVVSGAAGGDLVTLSDGNAVVATKTVPTGATTVTFNGASADFTLADGAHSFTATRSVAPKVSGSSAPFAYTLDTAAPAAPAIASVEGDETSPALGSDTTPSVVVNGLTGGDVVALFVDGVEVATATVADGAATLTFNAAESTSDFVLSGDGRKVLTAGATDPAGNTSPASASYRYDLDTTAPKTPAVEKVNGTSSSPASGTETEPTIFVTGVTPGDVVTLVDNGTDLASLTVPAGTSIATFNGGGPRVVLVEGQHSLQARARDAAGNTSGTSTAFVYEVVVESAPAPEPNSPQGYTLVGEDGRVYSFGTEFHQDLRGEKLNAPVIGIANTPSGKGYWMVARDGGIFTFGDAGFFGSTGDKELNAPMLGMEPTPTGNGYWLFAADGGIFTFGDAAFFGSTGDMKLNAPMIGMERTAGGDGYWLVAQDGGIFSFGNAPFFGSTGDMELNQPVFDVAAVSDGSGYWLVARDGGIFTFGPGATFHGSAVGRSTARTVGIGDTPSGDGYWIADTAGNVFAFGDARLLGEPRSQGISAPIVGFAALQ